MSALTSFMRTRHPRCAGRNSIRRAITEALEARQFLTSVVVNTTADQVDPAGSATVSLRDAIAIANASTTPTAITFDPTVFASRQTITLTVGTRLILQNASEPITVTGPAEPLTISGNNATGIFVVWNGTTASISNLILTAGKSGNGAGIDSYGNSTVSNVSITKSSANYGGAIFNSGNLNLSDSTLSGNSATYGGAFSDAAGGTATLTNVTIANNNATYGGGISNGLSGETGSTTLADDTIAANSSNAGGGIFNYPGTGDVVTLGNTIVADNGGTASTAVGPDVDGQVSSQGFDLIDQSNGSTGWTNQDLTGTEASPLNPELAALGNYGGDQQTVFLFSNSPAIGAGSVSLVPGGITTDERGLPRNFNGKVDIGAVEVQPNDATPTTPISPVVPPVAPTPPVTLPTVTALGQGTTASPGPVLDTASPTFQWDAVTGFSGLTGYQINLYDQTLGKGYTYKVGTSVTSYTAPSSVLAAGDKFVWNVRIIDGTQTGPESAYLYFQAPAAVVLPAPVATGPGSTSKPGDVLTTSTPTLSWNAVTGVTGMTGYQIYLTDLTASKTYSYQVGASATSFAVPSGTLTAGDDFVWNVRILVGTQSGPPSTYLYFQTPAATVALPAPVATGPGSTSKPGNVLTTSTPTLSWNAVTGVTGMTGYQIYLTDLTASKTYSYQVGASATSFAVPSGTLTAGDDFVWNVRILVGTQSGPPSTYLYFQTPAATVTLPAPVATGPGTTASPGPLLTNDTPTFQWSAVTGVSNLSGYQINVYDQTSKTSYTFKTGASVDSYTVAAGVLTAGDSFVWNVRVLAGGQSGPPSAYLNFQTPAPVSSTPPPQTSAAQITADTEKLTRLEDEQHETVRSLKAAKPGTAKYETLLAKYEVWEKRIKSLKSARAALESDV